MRRKLNIKMLGIVLGCLLIAGVGVHFLHGYQLQQNAHRLLERGDRAFAEKDYDKAQLFYEQYLVFVPNDADTSQKYAQALEATATTESARVRVVLLMEQVLRMKPNEHELRFRLINNLIALERIPEAMENLRKLQGRWHDKAQVLHMLGWCQEANKEYPAAVASFEAALALDPKRIETHALLIEVYQDRLIQPEDALKAADEMVRANPDSHRAHLLRARFHLRSGDEKAAESDRQAAFKLAPDRPEVLLAVADAARARGNWEEATKILQEGLKKHPKHVEFIKAMVDVKVRTDHRDEAIALLDAAPKSSELTVLLIDLLIDQKEYADAQKRIDALLDAGLKPTLPNYLKARLRIANQEWNEAIKLLEGVRQELGSNSEWSGRVDALLGLSYRQIGDPEQELRAFQRAAQEEPAWPAANIGLAAALLDAGRVVDAGLALESIRQLRDLPSEYWLLMARYRLARQMRQPEAQRHWDGVEEALAKADSAKPASLESTLVRASVLAARRDFAAAQTLLEKARGEHPKEIGLACAQAELSLRHNRLADAEKYLADAEAAFGDRLEIRLTRARLAAQAGDRAKLALLGENLPADWTAEQRARLSRTLADTWYQIGDRGRGEKLLRAVASALPKDLQSRSRLLDAELEKHQPAAARRWLAEIRAIEGNAAGALGRLGEIAIQIQEAAGRPAQLADVRAKLQELEKRNPNWPRIPLLSAALFEIEGKIPQAIGEYTRALDLGELQPQMVARLLRLLLERREVNKAETELGKYEEKLPLTPELARLGADIAVGLRNSRYAKLAVTRAEQAGVLPTRDYRDALWLARIYDAAGETKKGEALFRISLNQADHAPDVWVAWMQHLFITNQRPLGLQEIERMKKSVAPSRVALTLARCLEALHEPVRAAEAYHAAVKEQPSDIAALAYAADFHRRADQLEQAQALYVQLLEPERSAPEEFAVAARRHLAVLLAGKQTFDARMLALELLDENKRIRGQSFADERIRWYVQSLASPRELTAALKKFQESLATEVPTADERLLLAKMLESADQLTQARTQVTEAADENPSSPYYLARYIHVLIRSLDFDEAERQLTRMEALEPGSRRVRALRDALTQAREKV